MTEKIFVNNPTPTIQEEVLTLRIENAELERTIKSLQLKLNTNGCDSVTDYMRYIKERDKVKKLKKENVELKKDKEYLDNTNNEQTKVILELQERIREVENDSNNCEHWSYERIKQLEEQIENYKLSENESKEIIAELKAQIERISVTNFNVIEKLKARIEELENDNKALANNVVQLGEVIKKKEKLWKHLESRFVEVCKTCTQEEKAHCVMFPEYCEGECTEIVDLLGLLEKATEEGGIK